MKVMIAMMRKTMKMHPLLRSRKEKMAMKLRLKIAKEKEEDVEVVVAIGGGVAGEDEVVLPEAVVVLNVERKVTCPENVTREVDRAAISVARRGTLAENVPKGELTSVSIARRRVIFLENVPNQRLLEVEDGEEVEVVAETQGVEVEVEGEEQVVEVVALNVARKDICQGSVLKEVEVVGAAEIQSVIIAKKWVICQENVPNHQTEAVVAVGVEVGDVVETEAGVEEGVAALMVVTKESLLSNLFPSYGLDSFSLSGMISPYILHYEYSKFFGFAR